MSSNSIRYSETDERLAVRIRAHTEYTNLQLEDWLRARLGVKAGGRVLDIACGNGNFFPVYSACVGEKGLLVGVDVSDSLLAAARRKASQLACPALILRHDFNNPLPFLDAEFDFSLCLFAAYYAKDPQAWLDEVLRVTRAEGAICLLGPTEDNARELYELNEALTGVGQIEDTDFTTARLTDEFLPALRARLGSRVRTEIIDRRIQFPSAVEFARYYLATWLYERTAERVGRSYSLADVEAKVHSHSLSKRVVALMAQR
jgi:SAM-dependent methyltransferase